MVLRPVHSMMTKMLIKPFPSVTVAKQCLYMIIFSSHNVPSMFFPFFSVVAFLLSFFGS